jgi:hypothetical protein
MSLSVSGCTITSLCAVIAASSAASAEAEGAEKAAATLAFSLATPRGGGRFRNSATSVLSSAGAGAGSDSSSVMCVAIAARKDLSRTLSAATSSSICARCRATSCLKASCAASAASSCVTSDSTAAASAEMAFTWPSRSKMDSDSRLR